MKTFKDLLNEVAEPRGGDEKRFKDKHVIAKTDDPHADEDVHVAKTKKKKRFADLEKGEDEKVYEEKMKDDDDDEEDEDDDDEEEEMEESEEDMSAAQMKKREEIVKSMKDKKDDFKKRYGDKWKSVMYATATKMAMKEAYEGMEGMCCKHCGDEFGKPKSESCMYNAYDMKGENWIKKESYKEEVDLSEDVMADLQKIVKTKSAGDVKFADGSKLKVDMFTASAMTKVHDALNGANQKKFADAINKNENMFMKMMDFAMSKVK